MSNTCGGIDFLQGGTITSSTIVNSEILSSVIRASEFNCGHITALASIDDSSIQTIVNGILGLPKEQLIAFATALLEAACGGTVGEPGRTSAEPLPTTMVGSRDLLLGAPSAWGTLFGKQVPLYEGGA